MAYRLGIANGYRDLLIALHRFVTSYKMIDNIVYNGGNTGNGNVTGEWADDDSGIVEDVWTILFTGSGTTYTVTGADSSHGLQSATGVVGSRYVTDGAEIGFRIVQGQVAWVAGDSITLDNVEGMAATQKWAVNRYNMVYDTDIVLPDPSKGTIGSPNYDIDAAVETWSVKCTNIGTPAVFSVIGSVSGTKASATVGVAYDNGIVSFTLTAGTTAWAVDDTITFDIPMAREIFFEAPGNGGNENIYTMIRTYENLVPGDAIYHWILNGATGFLPANNFYNQPDSIVQQTDLQHVCPRCCQADETQPMPYWLVANGRRVTMFYEVDTVIECMHLGYILPYALPTELPYALMVGGTTSRSDFAFNKENIVHRAFWDSGHSGYTTAQWASCFCWQQQVPVPIGNRYSDSNEQAPLSNILSTINFGATFPYHHGYSSASANSEGYYWVWSAGANVDGSLCLYPIIAHCRVGLRGAYGEIEGIFAIMGDLTFSKDITIINGKTYVAFPNVHRSTRFSWCVLRLE